MPSYKGGYYRQRRDTIEVWAEEEAYANGEECDWRVLIDGTEFDAIANAKRLIRSFRRRN